MKLSTLKLIENETQLNRDQQTFNKNMIFPTLVMLICVENTI